MLKYRCRFPTVILVYYGKLMKSIRSKQNLYIAPRFDLLFYQLMELQVEISYFQSQKKNLYSVYNLQYIQPSYLIMPHLKNLDKNYSCFQDISNSTIFLSLLMFMMHREMKYLLIRVLFLYGGLYSGHQDLHSFHQNTLIMIYQGWLLLQLTLWKYKKILKGLF